MNAFPPMMANKRSEYRERYGLNAILRSHWNQYRGCGVGGESEGPVGRKSGPAPGGQSDGRPSPGREGEGSGDGGMGEGGIEWTGKVRGVAEGIA